MNTTREQGYIQSGEFNACRQQHPRDAYYLLGNCVGIGQHSNNCAEQQHVKYNRFSHPCYVVLLTFYLVLLYQVCTL